MSTEESDVDKWLEKVMGCEPLEEASMRKLLRLAKSILFEESNCVIVKSPVNICGDVHGQFYDVRKLFEAGGDISDTRYIFMGDYVDRGYNSLETLTYLLLLKVKYPDRITLIRGNHESRQITQVYGFYDECKRHYGSALIWKLSCEVFDMMSLCAVVDGKIFCVHGGLSPSIKAIDQIRILDRRMEVPHEGPFCDLLWSDPEEIDGWCLSQRGAGWLFGGRIAKEYSHLNNLELISRSHQLVLEGYKYHFKEKNLVTVWSAPNYCYRCGNLASILQVDEKRQQSFKIFHEDEGEHKKHRPKTIGFFV